MRRKIAYSSLLFAFFAPGIVIFGGPAMGHPIPENRVLLRFAPDEIIVKFKNAAAAALEEKTSAGTAAGQLELPGSLDKLNRKFGLRNIKPLLKNFKADRERLKALSNKDKALLTKHEKRILQRLRRAPQKATIPALDRIYKLQFSLAPDESIQEIMAAYNDDPSVEYAELNHRISIRKEPDDPCYPLQWSLDNIGQDYPVSGKYGFPPGTPDSDIDAPQAWDFHTGNSEIVIAVVDTGVDYAHRDLQGNIWINSGEIPGNHADDDGNGYIDDIYGYDFLNNDSDPNDDHGHGTHCSGIIAAGGNNGLDITGVCWNAKIMALKFLDDKGEGFSSDGVIALYYAAKNGADVISNSWSSPFSSDAMEEVIEYVHSLGVIMVAAAGNKNHALPHYPAFYEHVIAVAATDSDDKRAPFSNYGMWVDIAAPGVDVLSLRAGLTSMGTIYDDYTTVASGTSMACPHVAAVIALIISNHPNTSTHVITERLFRTTDDISSQNPGFDGMLGAGRVNAYKAVRDGFQGIVTFDSDFYSCDDIVSIEVFDFDLIGQGTHPITLTTDAGDLETVTVFEDTNKPWLFTGTIRTSSDAVIAEDGILQLSHGQIITATYSDGDDGTGNPAATTATATADCVSPEIVNVQIDVPGPEPEVTFQTNEPTTARVLCGLTCGGPYIIEATSSILSTSHSIKLRGVSPTTDYFYIVEAADAVGNKTVDDNAGACYAFTTDVGPRDIYVPAQYPTIQEAIKRSWNGGTVWVADGFYQGPGNRDIDFLGRAITVRSENGPFTCIIDCQGSKVDPHRGFYFHKGEGATSVLDGFMIINGYATDEGGGIYCTASSPTLINCMFYSNSAQYWGGAISNRGSSSTLINCTFGENTARWGGAVACCYCYEGPTLAGCTFSNNSARHGGALYNDHSRSKVTNCDFSNNSATYGAGVYNFGGVYDVSYIGPKLQNCTFSANHSSSLGGGMFNFESSPTVTNCEFNDNSALHYAGAVYSSDGSNPILDNCTFSANSAEHGGAIYCLEDSRAVFANCLMTGNSAQLNGGGVYGGLGQVRNCTIVDNAANIGGGLYGCNGQVTNCLINGNIAISHGGAFSSCNGPIINCTIADNSGGGLDSCFGTIINCIIWNGDTGGSPGESVLSVSSVPLYSCVQGGSDGIGCISSDPRFIDAQNGDYHLLPNSPCKDSGNYYYCMNLPCTDLDGLTRMAGVQIDMGCYEAGSTPDIDGDWLAASQEGLYGTHPNLPDTDGDGLADGLEILGGTAPLAADPLRTWQVPTDSITIQQALFFSRPGEVIILAEGTYYENIYFGGRNITLTGSDPNEPNVVAATVVDGDTDRDPETMSGRVVNLIGTENNTCHISGLTITGGCTNTRGGGIYGAGARAGISKSIISSNYALDGGGGLYECDGPVTNCTVTGNLAADGGGLYYCNGPIADCTIIANQADFRGGAMFNCGGEYICYGPNDCVFSIENCFIGDNTAHLGGGIYNSVTSPTLTKCTFSCNTAEDYGGGMYNYKSSPEMTNCIFSGNTANCGGAMYNYEHTKPTLTNCTFAQNSAPNGNALVCDSNDQQYPSYLQITNCILWDGGDEVWNNDSSTIIITYSDVQGGWPDVGNIDADPLFADTNKGDYRLLAGSPCIDSAIEAGVYEDIDGNIRPFDFPGADCNDGSPGFDMGAYEAVATTQCELIVLPRIIIRGGGGEKITVIIRLPETIAKDDIDAYEPLVLHPGAIKSIRQNLIPPSIEAKSNTRIHAVFDKTKLLAATGDNGDIELTATGRFNTGKYFYGTDTIRIISPWNEQEQ